MGMFDIYDRQAKVCCEAKQLHIDLILSLPTDLQAGLMQVIESAEHLLHGPKVSAQSEAPLAKGKRVSFAGSAGRVSWTGSAGRALLARSESSPAASTSGPQTPQ
jgi:hypothetical protein